jgi:hypothetical protein
MIYFINLSPCSIKVTELNWAWWFMSGVPALRKLRQKDYKFEANLGYRTGSRPSWAT